MPTDKKRPGVMQRAVGSWKSVWQAAEEELRRREIEMS
jgi:hypothetical protein